MRAAVLAAALLAAACSAPHPPRSALDDLLSRCGVDPATDPRSHPDANVIASVSACEQFVAAVLGPPRAPASRRHQAETIGRYTCDRGASPSSCRWLARDLARRDAPPSAVRALLRAGCDGKDQESCAILEVGVDADGVTYPID